MTSKIELLTIENKPVPSNSHVFYNSDSKHCIVVDPGSEEGQYIDGYLTEKELIPDYIILTHEHFDHIWACEYFVNKYHTPIVCSKMCAGAIVNARTNLSLFYENKKAFNCPPASLIVEDIDFNLEWGDEIIFFNLALGHSIGGIFFTLQKYLVTGDTLIKDIKTVTKLKCGSKEKLKESLALIDSMKGRGLLVCAGHGESFELDSYDLKKALL